MRNEVQLFIEETSRIKNISSNTKLAYKRDLCKMIDFFERQGITDVSQISSTSVNSYLLFLEKEEISPSSVQRYLSAMKSFFRYEYNKGYMREEPTLSIKPSNIARERTPMILTVDEINCLIGAVDGIDEKSSRDRAMLELLYSCGMRVTEIINLKVNDVNLNMGYITCGDGKKSRVIPFGAVAKQYLAIYLKDDRAKLVKGEEVEWLFTNCFGRQLTRQGYWKVLKAYAKKAGINKEITPYSLRHSFAAHLVQNGADLKSLQEMLGFTDVASTRIYTRVKDTERIGEVYRKAHPHS